MRLPFKVLGAAAGGTFVGAVAAAAVASRQWDRATDRAVQRLTRRNSGCQTSEFSLEQLEGLPAPVVRYLLFALTPGQSLISRARVEQSGEFRTGITALWKPLYAVQHYAVDPPGFVWDANIRVAAPLTVRVRDSYLDGQGAVQARLSSLFTLANESGREELDRGALHRFLAEAVWLPTALLPSQNVQWSPLNDSAAVATLTDGTNRVSLDFQFGEHGQIIGASTPVRYRAVDGEYLPTRWECSYRNYALVGSIQVPREAEAAWVLEEGPFSYFRGRVPSIDFGFAKCHP